MTAYVEFVKEEIEVLPEFSEWFSQAHPAEDLNDYDDESLVGFYDEFLKSGSDHE